MFKKRREHESPRIYHELTINYSCVAKLILRIAYSLETYPWQNSQYPWQKDLPLVTAAKGIRADNVRVKHIDGWYYSDINPSL